MPGCAKKGCLRMATQAFDVWSWLKPQRDQTPRHYEVCDAHAALFTAVFDRSASETTKSEFVESLA